MTLDQEKLEKLLAQKGSEKKIVQFFCGASEAERKKLSGFCIKNLKAQVKAERDAWRDGEYANEKLTPGKSTGVANMIRPDGTQPAPLGFDGGKAVNVPWGVSIDGNDDVWIGNFWGRGVVLMAGDDTKGHPEGTKTGDAIHVFQSGSIQMVTDVSIDPAGNAWVANNWNNVDAAGDADPARPTSTWGGGSGIAVIYGVAAPVKTPLMGQVRAYNR